MTQAKLSKLSNVGLISLAAHRDQAEKEKRTAEVKLPPPREVGSTPRPAARDHEGRGSPGGFMGPIWMPGAARID